MNYQIKILLTILKYNNVYEKLTYPQQNIQTFFLFVHMYQKIIYFKD